MAQVSPITVIVDVKETHNARMLLWLVSEAAELQKLVPTRWRHKAIKHVQLIERIAKQLIEIK